MGRVNIRAPKDIQPEYVIGPCPIRFPSSNITLILWRQVPSRRQKVPVSLVVGRRGYIYTGPVYAEQELDEQICPWCIADGTAHEQLGAEFIDAQGVGGYGTWDDVPDSIVRELVERTPCFSGWQQERWFTGCGDAAAFIARAGKTELQAAGEAALDAVRAESGYEGRDWAAYLELLDAEGSPTAYLFRCLHCGKVGGYSDCH